MVVFGVLAIFMFLASFFLTRERVVQACDKKSTLWQDLKSLFTNDQWLIIACVNFLLLIPVVIRAGAALLYEMVCRREDLGTAFLTTGMTASMIGAAFASR